jgi:predicted secreted protein
MPSVRATQIAVLAALGVVFAGFAPARAEEAGRRVSFQVEVSREVANDHMHAVLSVSEEDADPAAAAERVNRAMGWALEQARDVSAVQSKSGGYLTRPVEQEGRIRRWRASQELLLEGGDADAMAALLGVLQERLQLRAFRFSVSESLSRQVEDELVQEALAAFRARALLVQRSLESSGYEIDQLSVDTGGRVAPVMLAEARSAGPRSAPALEAGSSRISVTVHATVVLE